MAVLIEGINVIVPYWKIEEKYPGGVARYRQDAPLGTFCTDGLLTRVGFASADDADTYLQGLHHLGLVLMAEDRCADAALVDEQVGTPAACSWLWLERHESGIAYAVLAGRDSGAAIAVPPGWTLSSSMSQLGRRVEGELGQQLLYLRRDGGSDVYLDRANGKEVRVLRRSSRRGKELLN